MTQNQLDIRMKKMEDDISAIKTALGLSDNSSQDGTQPTEFRAPTAMRDEITSIFQRMGIPAHIKGYHYAREAILLCLSDPAMLDQLCKGIYPTVAQMFNTTPNRVERAIRHAIESCCTYGDEKVIYHYFNGAIYRNKGKPTNGQFIATLVDCLKERSRK